MQGKTAETRQRLAEIYRRLAKGFDLANVEESGVLLNKIS